MLSKIKKKKLTIAQAAEQWEDATQSMQESKALREESAEVLLEHLEKTGRSHYKHRIGLTSPAARTTLDQPKIRTFLGPRLHEFQITRTPRPGLTLLDPDGQ